MFIKICGLTTAEDALLSVALGADAVGFVFAPGSPRQITPQAATDIVKRLPHGTRSVGVFRDERPERVVEVVNTVGLRGAQLHGREPLSEVRWVRERVRFVIQAFSAGDPALATVANGPADVVLIDGADPGSGNAFDWNLMDGVVTGLPVLLAGGLTPDNVGEAIRTMQPFGVDVSTGVESAPGEKDPRKLRHFIEVAREAAAGLAAPGEGGGAAPYDWQAEQSG
jgi:phosphoribosylanthranilate isomerase